MNRNWYLPGGAALILGIAIHQPLLLILSGLSVLVVGTTDIWSTFCLHELHYKRELSEKRALFGEEITLSISVENGKMLPLPWLEIADTLPNGLPLRERRMRVDLISNRPQLENLFSPRWYERVTRRYTVLCNQRGVHTFGPAMLRSGDLFGFLTKSEREKQLQYLLVYPLIVPLSSFKLPPKHPFGDRRAPRRLLEDPSRVIGTRDYTYGDEMRRIHWKATARAMKMQSKVYEPTTTYTLALFLNATNQLDVHFGIHPELQELAICATASVADWAINEGYAVGLYANSNMYMPEMGMQMPSQSEQTSLEKMLDEQRKSRRIHLPPATSAEQRRRIMETLARVQPFFGVSIEDLLLAERTHLPAGATVVVVTSSISDPLLDTLARMKRNGHAVTILFVGDQNIASRLGGIDVHHLGGESTWKELSRLHVISSGTGETEQRAAVHEGSLAL